MPSTIELMTQELEKIGWREELEARAEGQADRARMRRRWNKRNRLPLDQGAENDPIVFDETKEEALYSLALEIEEGYEQYIKGNTARCEGMRKRIPAWMTWSMLNEWVQHFIAGYKLRKQQDAEPKIDTTTIE